MDTLVSWSKTNAAKRDNSEELYNSVNRWFFERILYLKA